ncbi:MAG: hypothetical protein M0R80_02180 [Proteobacteria bacterium]|jgi:hypothetical protein|nr:hypothetical protein [Pseudomonadota bacterium]
MNFRNWIEHKWYEFKDTVELYHGTSSALLPIIKTNGLVPPDECLESYAIKIIKSYGVAASPQLMEWIHKYAISSRANEPNNKIANVIYLTPKFENAKNYAKSTHKFGGEMAADIWRAINVIESKKRGLPKMQEIIPPIYKESHPVVLEVEIPSKWMNTYHDLAQRYKDALDYWATLKSKPDVHDFMEKEFGRFEIRVEETIPASMIRKIHAIMS